MSGYSVEKCLTNPSKNISIKASWFIVSFEGKKRHYRILALQWVAFEPSIAVQDLGSSCKPKNIQAATKTDESHLIILVTDGNPVYGRFQQKVPEIKNGTD